MSRAKYKIGSLEMKKGMLVMFVVAILAMASYTFREAKAYTYPCTIIGKVYDENGVPVAGAVVRIRDMNTGAWGENITDSNGNYTIVLGALGGAANPWVEWFDNDTLLGTATYMGRNASNTTRINASRVLPGGVGYLWLNFTLGTPVTTKHIGEPNFIKYDFDDGSRNYGYLVSERINVTQDVATLSFWTWWQIEGVNSSSYDFMNVSISTDGGHTFTLLKTLNPENDPTTPSFRDYTYYSSAGYNVEPVWVHEEIDISAYVPNEIIIMFSFDTNDSDYNYWEGWYVDDVTVTEFGGNVAFEDDIEHGVGNWTYTGYWHISTHRSHSSSHAWYYGIEHSYVTNTTLFNFTVEGGYTDVYYRIWNGTWTSWQTYTGNFTLGDEEGLYWLEFYAENGTNDEPLHNQSHVVDNSYPVSTYEFGSPHVNRTYYGRNLTTIKICTPMWINASDGEGAGVEWLNYSVWWNPDKPENFTKLYEVSVHDNDENDTDKRVGYITVVLHFEEECFHEIKWQMVDYLGHESIQHSVDIAVDATAPNITKKIMEPKYFDGSVMWVNCSTPIWINVTDDGCGGGVGVEKMGILVWWNETMVEEGEQSFILLKSIVVEDNDKNDSNPNKGEISYLFEFWQECFHEPEFWAIDYVGNNASFKEKDLVDCTPPAIRKDIPKIVALEQTEMNDSALVSDQSNDDWQSFKAPWSYIDAVSVHICGDEFNGYGLYAEIWNDTTLLATTETVNFVDEFCGWIQLHLLDRLYVEHGETYRLHLVSTGGGGFYWNASNEYPNDGPYPDGYAVVDGIANESWDFAFKIEYYPIFPYLYPTGYTLFNQTISHDGLDEIWLTSNATLVLNYWDEGCMGGVGEKELLYRIWFDGTWHPVHDKDMYCGNYNITYVDGKYWYVAMNETVSFTEIQFHEECTHHIEIMAKDLLGNTRIINQTHYVDDSPPRLHVEFPNVHGFYYDETEDKQFVRAGKKFWLNLTDEPECAVGWRNFTFFWRYEYWNYTTPEKEKHPANESDHSYPGEIVNISGTLWWKIVPRNASIPLIFNRECEHTIYYFYEATDWLDNSINESGNITIYVDAYEPELSKEHPVCYTERDAMYLHTPWDPLMPVEDPIGMRQEGYTIVHELWPEYCNQYMITSWHDGFEPWHGDGYGSDHGGKALVLYYNYSTNDGWVDYNYKEDPSWQLFREAFDNTGWEVNFTTHVNETLLAQYDALFILTPIEDIPNDEAQDIIEWVLDGGQLLITQNGENTYANEITEHFGILFGGLSSMGWNMTNFASDMLTKYPFVLTKVNGSSQARNITAMPPARELGWDNDGDCYLAINEHAGRGIVIAVGEEHLWEDTEIVYNDNSELLVNILYRFYKHSMRQLKPCHYIDMIPYPEGDEEPEWYHVEDLTITLYLKNVTYVDDTPIEKYMYVEFTDGFDYVDYAMFNPVCTTWQEIWPDFGNEYHLSNWTDNDDGYLSHCDFINLTDGREETRWHVEEVSLDLIVRPIPFIQACQRINLTAKDMPDILKRVDQFVIIEKGEENISSPDTIQVYNSTTTPWPWDCQEFVPTSNAINEVRLYLDWSGDADIVVYIRNGTCSSPSCALGYNVTHVSGTGKGWVTFVFNPAVNVTAGESYYIEVHRIEGSALARWYYIDKNKYLQGDVWISGEEHRDADWAFETISYLPNPCASGIEGIYFAYEYKGMYHPANRTDNITKYGAVVDIGIYYSQEEIDTYFGGHNLWYVYDESKGVHFHEECMHILYYWAKDNVCHHTPVYKQVYFVDEYKPTIEKRLPEHGYYTPVTIDVDPTFDNNSGNYEGEFHVRNKWSWNAADGWDQQYAGDYVNKTQEIWFKISNNDPNKDLILKLHIEEIVGDEGITFVNHGGDVNYFNDTIIVPALDTLYYYVYVYDNYEALRWGVWHWWVEVENVTQYLRAGANITLIAEDHGDCQSGIEAIFWRYEWNNTTYPQAGHPAAINGSEFEKYGYDEEITSYWWYVVYANITNISFNEECRHDLYYWTKDRVCHNSTVHHQVYYVDASPPIVDKILPEHGAIGDATVSLEEGFGIPFDGWAIVNGSSSYWMLKSNEPLNSTFYHDVDASYSGRYYAMAWRDDGTADTWLITPLVHIPEDGNLTFWYATYYSSYNEAAFKVCVNNISYQTDTSAFVEIWDSGVFGDTTYRKAEIDLSDYAGQDVYIGFYCYYLETAYPYGGLTIDDVWIGGIERITILLDDDVESGADGWTIDDLTVTQDSYWRMANRLPASPPDTNNVEWNATLPWKPAVWCGDLSLGSAPNGGNKYGCNWNDALTLKEPIDLSTATGIVNLTYSLWMYTDALNDWLAIDVSVDKVNWTTLTAITGQTAWTTFTENLTSYIGNDTVWIRFRFITDDSPDYYENGVFIDNVTIYNETHTWLYDTFENLDNWDRSMLETSKWHIVDDEYHSYNHSWWCGNDATGEYLACMDDVLISPEIDLTGYSYEELMLTFWHKRDLPDYGDYGRVEVRYYSGGAWSNWYTIAYYRYSRDWVQEFINLTEYIGHPEKVQFRFRFVSDTDTSKGGGWHIDDIRLELRNYTTTEFEDDFERTFPPAGWLEIGNYVSSLHYGWTHYQTPEFTYAMVHAWYAYDQDEWLITPLIEDLPKFSNLTFMHRFAREDSDVRAYVYIQVDGGTWQYLATIDETYGMEVIEDISLWPYHGHDIKIAFRFVSPKLVTSDPFYGDYTYDDDNYWAIEWVDITSFGFLRACAPVILNATDLPLDSECDVGVSGIYWRYEYGGMSIPYDEDYHYEGYWRYGWEIPVGYWVFGWEIPGITNETYPDIGPYGWYIYDPENGIHLPENCTHELYYFAKDYVCHTSELHHERWYVDGKAPETWLNISWGNHPWIPKNDEIGLGPYAPEDHKPDVICIYDDIELIANHTGKKPCIYPYNWQNATYYRWVWFNESSYEYEFWPTPSTPGAINGSEIVGKDNPYYDKIAYNDSDAFWFYEDPPFDGWIYWMKYEEPFYFEHECEHWLFYFSKDDLCNTEEPNIWHVGVDNMPPVSKIEFNVTEGTVHYDEENNMYYFQNCTWFIINATDMPDNPDCQTGIWYIEYTVWKWITNEVDIQLLTNEIVSSMTVYIGGNVAGNIISWVDSDHNGMWNYCDYMYIDWQGIYDSMYNDGWFHVEDIAFTGYWTLTIKGVFGDAGGWEPLIPWTIANTSCLVSPYDGIYYDKWYDDEGREYVRIWIHLGELVYNRTGNWDVCGKYEIHWKVWDYNNMSIEGEQIQDVAIDCTPPRTSKEFSMPYVEEEIGGGETIHWVSPYTKIWLNGTDNFIWDSGVNETWYMFLGEMPILLWKYGVDEIEQPYYPGVYTESKHWFNISEAVKIILGDENATIEDYFEARPGLTSCKIELYHWSVDNVSHVEDYQPSKQHLYIDYLPPASRVADIIPYNQTEVPINITVVDIADYGCENIGPVGVCKVEVYYMYSEDNETWPDEWTLYAVNSSLITHEDGTAENWTLQFTAPEGAGYYRFISIAYDCVGNVEQPPYYHGTYDAECLLMWDTEPPVIHKRDGEPYVEIEMGGEPVCILSWSTPIYITVVDMPDPENASGVDELKITFTAPGPATEWYDIPKVLWTINEAGESGFYNITYEFTLADYEDIAGLVEGELYHLYVNASDLYGHSSQNKTQKFIIDGTAPETSIMLECTGEMPFNVTVNATDDFAGVGNVTLYFKYSEDNETWTDWMEYGSSCGNYTWQFIYTNGAGYYKPGYYRFYVYAEDMVGNAKALPEELEDDYYEAWCYVPPWPEDFNGDGHVGIDDLLLIVVNWGMNDSSPDWQYVEQFDLDGNNEIGLGDLIALAIKWTG